MPIFKNTVVVVYALIKNSKNEFLIIKRARHDSMPGVWEMPGGTLEFGEGLEEGVKREVMEEVNLDVEVLNPINFDSRVKGNLFKTHKVRIAFKVNLKAKFDVKLSRDHSEYRWVKKITDEKVSSFLTKTVSA